MEVWTSNQHVIGVDSQLLIAGTPLPARVSGASRYQAKGPARRRSPQHALSIPLQSCDQRWPPNSSSGSASGGHRVVPAHLQPLFFSASSLEPLKNLGLYPQKATEAVKAFCSLSNMLIKFQHQMDF